MSALEQRELRSAIARASRRRLEIVEARAHQMASSCPLAEISLREASGRRSHWLLKDLGGRPADAGPPFLYEEQRELATYRILAKRRLAAPR